MKDDIFVGNGKLKSKNDEVWQKLSADLRGELSAKTLYSKICNPAFRKKLGLDQKPCHEIILSENRGENLPDTSVEIEEICSDDEEDVMHFSIDSAKEEYEKLFVTKEYKRREFGRRQDSMRTCLRLEPGRWEHWISDEIWNVTKLPCSFNFRGHYLTQDGNAGKVEGTYFFNIYKTLIEKSTAFSFLLIIIWRK